MPRNPAKYLYDVSSALSRIERFLQHKSFSDYESDDLVRSAVERQFEIVGEALNQLEKAAPDLASEIPEYRRIIAFRNVLIHGYAEVDNRLVWGIVEGKLPGLKHAVRVLMSRD